MFRVTFIIAFSSPLLLLLRVGVKAVWRQTAQPSRIRLSPRTHHAIVRRRVLLCLDEGWCVLVAYSGPSCMERRTLIGPTLPSLTKPAVPKLEFSERLDLIALCLHSN
jgi:hypothetical protein